MRLQLQCGCIASRSGDGFVVEQSQECRLVHTATDLSIADKLSPAELNRVYDDKDGTDAPAA